MKIHVTIDTSELYGEEDSSFDEMVKHEIAREVKTQILKDWNEKIKAEFNEAVIKEVQSQKQQFITDTMTDLIVNAKVKKLYSSGEMVSIADWIKDELERTHLSQGSVKDYLDKQIKVTTDSISKALKERYDMLFASQIVSKLHENKMLKDDVARLLLGDDTNQP